MISPLLLCDDCIVDQAQQTYSLWQGLNESHRQSLLDFSRNDTPIVENTSDAERFSSPEKLEKWLSGERIFYVLTPKNKPNEMLGLVWFSLEPSPIKTDRSQAKNSQWTFAIRLYEKARGRRLSAPFMKKSFEYFQRSHPNESVWLSTKQSNQIAQKIYEQFGFEQLGTKGGRLFYIIWP